MSRSEAEEAFFGQLRMLARQPGGFPLPSREHRFHPERKWRFDFAWPSRGIAVEVEGGLYMRAEDGGGGRHTRGSTFEADAEKYNEAAIMGWLVLRVSPHQVDSGEAIAWLARAMKSRALFTPITSDGGG